MAAKLIPNRSSPSVLPKHTKYFLYLCKKQYNSSLPISWLYSKTFFTGSLYHFDQLQ